MAPTTTTGYSIVISLRIKLWIDEKPGLPNDCMCLTRFLSLIVTANFDSGLFYTVSALLEGMRGHNIKGKLLKKGNVLLPSFCLLVAPIKKRERRGGSNGCGYMHANICI